MFKVCEITSVKIVAIFSAISIFVGLIFSLCVPLTETL